MNHRLRLYALAACIVFAAPAHSLQIVLNDVNPGGSGPLALDGFKEAAMFWEHLFTDDVTVRIDISFESLPPGVLGGTRRAFDDQVLYSDFRAALLADATSSFDAQATSSLTDTDTFNFVVQDLDGTFPPAYAINPVGFGVLDINTKLDVNTATLKALGLLADDGVTADAAIRFSSDFTFDFDRSDGIDAGAFDFVGVAAHEIGHALGFISGVDFLDFFTAPGGPGSASGPFDLDDMLAFDFGIASPLDLFRFSEATRDFGVAAGLDPLRDLTFGVLGDVYFSLDGGFTNLATFSTGVFNGDGRQASHWEDNLGLGLMDPTAARGELLTITDLDRLAFDVIGWDVAQVSEPGTFALLLLGLGALVAAHRRQKV